MRKRKTTTYPFWKYHGAGNDFIILEGVAVKSRLTKQRIRRMCDRHVGIGADGLICITPHLTRDFRMYYYNADGRVGSFCGNGSRCAVLFAAHRNILKGKKQCIFIASDGLHSAKWYSNEEVQVNMKPVLDIKKVAGDTYFLDTGSPHLVRLVSQPISQIDLLAQGRKIRYSPIYAASGGVNVNFVELGTKKENIKIRTYERGVEAETLACGTGITAAAIAICRGKVGKHCVQVQALGGKIVVCFECRADFLYHHITQRGPARHVFQGEITL